MSIINGTVGNDSLTGRSSSDILSGGAGNDTYIISNSLVTIIEANGQGIDTVNSSVTYALGNNIENLILTGSTNISGTGNALDNVITGNNGNNVILGNAGNDTLNGKNGADTLIGGLGNDVFYVDNSRDRVYELNGQGMDTINSSISWDMSLNNLYVENLTLTGSGNISAIGNQLNNIIRGNTGDNILDGYLGTDTLIGGAGNDIYIAKVDDVIVENLNQGTDTVKTYAAFTLSNNIENLILLGVNSVDGEGNNLNNTLTGNSGSNVLYGYGGNDILNGGGGNGIDTLIGGTGNDTYYVDNLSDEIQENAGEGIDKVFASSSYILSDNIESLTLTGTALLGTGNASNNLITGNALNNILNGKAGIDTMVGGAGSDTYYVDNTSDSVVEKNTNNVDTGGSDLVIASCSYTLSAYVDYLILADSAGDVNGTGNSLNNTIKGNIGDNIINGGSGRDIMLGGTGDDTYYVDNYLDLVTEKSTEGTDIIISTVDHTLENNVENLTLSGSARAGFGNSLDNIITGNNYNNELRGLGGSDTLDGGTGNDLYYFSANDGIDTVIDTTGTEVYQFGSTVSRANIAIFLDTDNSLIIDYGLIAGTSQVIINNWDASADASEKIYTTNYKYLSGADIDQIIQQINSYSGDDGPITSITDAKCSQDIMTIIASSWHSL